MNNDPLALQARVKELEQIRDRQQQRLSSYRGQVAMLRTSLEHFDCEHAAIMVNACRDCSSSARDCHIAAALADDAGIPETTVIKAAELIRAEELADFEAALGKPQCDCDPSVGMAPCMDCVLRQGLLRLRRVHEAVQIMLAEKRKPK